MATFHRRSALGTILLLAGIGCLAPCVARAAGVGKGLCATAAADHSAPPYVVVVSAFPAELAPIVAAAEIETTVQLAGRPFYVGRLAGVSVMLGLTGIGLVNATNTTHGLLENRDIAGLVMSGTAGTKHHIGDVVLASDLMESGRKRVFHPNPALVALARRASTALPEPLERCTPIPPRSTNPPTCLLFDPVVIFGGTALSADPFKGAAGQCTPGGGEIFGCELPSPMVARAAEISSEDVEDMETAAVAREAARRRVPFLAVRAASDGGGDPRGDRGFPLQFFDYYRLAAHNAGDVTRGVIAELGRLARDGSARRTCRLLAAHHWRSAAKRIAVRPNG